MEEVMTREEAEKLIEKWADILELDKKRTLYRDILEELTYPVQLGKLSFEEDTEVFKLMLRKPIKEGEKVISFVEIRSASMKDKQVLQRYKDDESIEQAQALIAKYTGLTPAQVGMLFDTDVSRINAVAMGFLAQISPQKKS